MENILGEVRKVVDMAVRAGLKLANRRLCVNACQRAEEGTVRFEREKDSGSRKYARHTMNVFANR